MVSYIYISYIYIMFFHMVSYGLILTSPGFGIFLLSAKSLPAARAGRWATSHKAIQAPPWAWRHGGTETNKNLQNNKQCTAVLCCFFLFLPAHGYVVKVCFQCFVCRCFSTFHLKVVFSLSLGIKTLNPFIMVRV